MGYYDPPDEPAYLFLHCPLHNETAEDCWDEHDDPHGYFQDLADDYEQDMAERRAEARAEARADRDDWDIVDY